MYVIKGNTTGKYLRNINAYACEWVERVEDATKWASRADAEDAHSEFASSSTIVNV